ncbi:MAG: wax ester/triacylglycerol synthase family O-acyltransferase [Deltaproteobacteria bacterium]|nr:wax ester/triacylglycerol synthase family O-acyltransferase [Deltaproteobacteria bacterium]
MRPLSPVDSTFLTAETRQTPMHVGSLLLLRPPRGSGEGYLQELCRDFSSVAEFRPPFDQKLVHPPSRLGMPHWETDRELDAEYHFRHSALPHPGRYRELFVLVSRLHGTLLDRSRPLFEYHIIEGLESGQFAIYAKVHHAVLDGIAGMKLLKASLSESEDERKPYPWSREADGLRPKRERSGGALDARKVLEMAQAQLGTVPGVARAAVRALESFAKPRDERMAMPFDAPRSAINAPITGARRFVAQSYALDRVDRIRAAYGATVNDIILAMCASALRRYLQEFGGGVPDKPLTAMTPISFRPEGAEGLGNAVTAVLVNLGTHVADPLARLELIRTSMTDGKNLVKGLTLAEVTLFTSLTFAPLMAPTMFGVSGRMPATNLIISNVPGPTKRLYWNGALMEGMYPVSIVTHGLAMNITVTSYAGSLDFGIVACRRTVPRVQRLIDFLEEGLAELERGAGL